MCFWCVFAPCEMVELGKEELKGGKRRSVLRQEAANKDNSVSERPSNGNALYQGTLNPKLLLREPWTKPGTSRPGLANKSVEQIRRFGRGIEEVPVG